MQPSKQILDFQLSFTESTDSVKLEQGSLQKNQNRLIWLTVSDDKYSYEVTNFQKAFLCPHKFSI